MSLFFYDFPIRESDRSILNNSIFDDFEEELFDHPFTYTPHHYQNYRSSPQGRPKTGKKPMNNAATKRPSAHIFDKDVYKLVDFCPRVNLGEDDTNYYIEADLPGMSKEQIQMELTEENVLTISGERAKKESNGLKSTKMDCLYGKFSRSFSLPETAKLDGIQAKMENGVLEVIIPKAEPPKSQRRTIQIQ